MLGYTMRVVALLGAASLTAGVGLRRCWRSGKAREPMNRPPSSICEREESMSDENQALIRRYFAELVSQGNLAAADELFAAD